MEWDIPHPQHRRVSTPWRWSVFGSSHHWTHWLPHKNGTCDSLAEDEDACDSATGLPMMNDFGLVLAFGIFFL